LKVLIVVNDTVKVNPESPITVELEASAEICMRAGVNPVIVASYLTALAFPLESIRNACTF
jgi:hypothetical protein